MAKLNIYRLFATVSGFNTLSTSKKRKKSKKKKARSSRMQVSFRIGVLKNFAHFTGKHLCRSPFLIKLQALRLVTLLKRDSKTGVFL